MKLALTLCFSLIKLRFFTYIMFCVSIGWQRQMDCWKLHFSITLHAKIDLILKKDFFQPLLQLIAVLSSRTSILPGSTLCWSPLLVSMRFRNSWVLSALETSWGCTGMKPWFGLTLSRPIPFPKGRCSQSLWRQIEGEGKEKRVNQKLLSGTLSSESPRVCP